MSLNRIALVAVLVALPASLAIAEPPRCDEISQALERTSDPAEVAKKLDTTRARINACSKLTHSQERHRQHRARYTTKRIERGYDH